MTWTCTLVREEYSPAEAAAVTGVSTALQRDWRRRELLASAGHAGRWTRWELDDLIRLSVMKLFSDAGMDVSKTGTLAAMAILPTLGALEKVPGALVFEADGVSEKERDDASRLMAPRLSSGSRHFGRFLAAFGPDEHDICRTAKLEDLEALLAEKPRPIMSIVDCWTLAHLIQTRLGRPVLRYVVSPSDRAAENA